MIRLAASTLATLLLFGCGTLGDGAKDDGKKDPTVQEPDPADPTDPMDPGEGGGTGGIGTDPGPTATPPTGDGEPPVPPDCKFKVRINLDQDWAGVETDLYYPPDQVEIPGSGEDATVWDSVSWRFKGGSRFVWDDDSNFDQLDDVITIGQSENTNHSYGWFVVVTFKCLKNKIDQTAFRCVVTNSSNTAGKQTPNSCDLDFI